MVNIDLINGDCIEEMKKMKNKNIKIDLVLTYPPYGTTTCKWDSIIPFNEMWDCLNNIIPNDVPILLFGSEPFSSNLRMSNIKNYKYDWIWVKERGTGFARSNKQPLRKNENISVFYKKQPYYNSQGEKLKKPYRHALPIVKSKSDVFYGNNLTKDGKRIYKTYTHTKKHNILEFSRNTKNSVHPTQKPVALLEYLIKTYTNEGDTILDFTMGSGSTGVACINTNRNFIGIELDEEYFNIAKERINGVNDE